MVAHENSDLDRNCWNLELKTSTLNSDATVIKLMLKIIQIIILITISCTFFLFPVGLLFFTVAAEEKYCKLWQQRKPFNYEAPTLSPAPPAALLRLPSDQCVALCEPCSQALSYTMSPCIKIQVLGPLFKADCMKHPFAKGISKSSNTYAVLNGFINTYFYSFTSMSFPQYIVETSETFCVLY